jgi:hypothetical protein
MAANPNLRSTIGRTRKDSTPSSLSHQQVGDIQIEDIQIGDIHIGDIQIRDIQIGDIHFVRPSNGAIADKPRVLYYDMGSDRKKQPHRQHGSNEPKSGISSKPHVTIG